MGLSLIYHAGALGDFVTALPAMRAWRRLHPGDGVVLLGKAGHAELAPPGLFDEAWEAGSSLFTPLFGREADVPPLLTARFRRFSSALLFSSAVSALPENLARLGVREIVWQHPFPAERVPIVDYHLSLFPSLAFTEEDARPQVRCARGALPVPANAVALHPGSGDKKKNWPFAKFQDLAGGLEATGLVVRWVLGPAEKDLVLPYSGQAWRNVSLSDLAGALTECRLFVGNDSGVAHLAAAVGCPTVALFGASDAAVWAPRGRAVRLVQAPRGILETLSGEIVLSECLGFLRR
ncbi:MAG: glycosyltransferase family 9 protein [Spirochaetia bacterium]